MTEEYKFNYGPVYLSKIVFIFRADFKSTNYEKPPDRDSERVLQEPPGGEVEGGGGQRKGEECQG